MSTVKIATSKKYTDKIVYQFLLAIVIPIYENTWHMGNLSLRILSFQGANALSTLLVVTFVTLYLLGGSKGITDVAQGSIMISVLTVAGFYLTNILYKHYQFSHTFPIKIASTIIICIGFILWTQPSLGRFAYGLFGLSVGFYYAGNNMIMIHDVDYQIRPKYTGTLQTITGLIGIIAPLLIGFSFKQLGSDLTYQIIFYLIILAGCIMFASVHKLKTNNHFEYHSLQSLKSAFTQIPWAYLIAMMLLGAMALRSQIDVIIPHTISLNEANISFIVAFIRLVGIVTVFAISYMMTRSQYPKLMRTVIIALISTTVLFIRQYNFQGYLGFAIVSTICGILFVLSQSVISTRRIEHMPANTRSISLIGEVMMATSRICLGIIMLLLGENYIGPLFGQVIIGLFILCICSGGRILYKQGQKMEL